MIRCFSESYKANDSAGYSKKRFIAAFIIMVNISICGKMRLPFMLAKKECIILSI